MSALQITLAAIALAALAEWLHVRRCRRVARLAFGPGGAPRSWTKAAPWLRVAAVGALTWGFLTLLQIGPQSVRREEFVPEGGFRHLIIALDASPSMFLNDAGVAGKQTRAARASEVLQSLLGRIALDQVRISIVAFYTGAKPVVVDTSDMGGKDYTTAAINAIPTAAWRAENGAVAESDPTFRGVVATPRSLAFFFKVSRELLADAPDIQRALLTAIGQAFAKALDRTGLRGSGVAPEPMGLLGTAGVHSVTNGADGATLNGYANLFSAVEKILRDEEANPNIVDFWPYGYDERQYNSPAFRLNVGLLLRSRFGLFPEYHTSADNMDFIKPEFLEKTYKNTLQIIDVLENEYKTVNLAPHGEPNLGKRGLYGAIGGDKKAYDANLPVFWMLNQSDGEDAKAQQHESGTGRDPDIWQCIELRCQQRSEGDKEEQQRIMQASLMALGAPI